MPASPPTNSGLRPATIEAGKLLAVDAERWTATVYAFTSHRTLEDVALPALYLHPNTGEGIWALPEPGALVYLCMPSDGDLPVILSYRAAPQAGVSRAGGRASQTPGDMAIVAADGNGLRVSRSGAVDLASSEIARITLTPADNRVSVLAEQYELTTFGGSLHWGSGRPEETAEGTTATRLLLDVYAYEEDAIPCVHAQIGGELDAVGVLVDTPVLEVQINAAEDTETPKVVVAANAEGDVGVEAVSITVESPEVQVHLTDSGTMTVYGTDAGAAQATLLGETFLQDLSAALLEILALLTPLAGGTPPPNTNALYVKIQTTLATKGAPLLSSRLKVE